MERSSGIRWSRRWVAIIGIVAVTIGLVTFAGVASGSSTRSKTVQASGTVKVPAGTEGGSPGTALFTVGHARVQGECGLDPNGTGGILKVQIVAVGGPIAITVGPDGSSGRVLDPADPDATMDAIIVFGTADPTSVTSTKFAVLDDAGPSFSGTAGAWYESSTGPCMFTAQVAG